MKIFLYSTKKQTMAMAITSAVTSLFGQLPGPLVYGYLYDLSCTLHRDHDEKSGDCLQYDNELIKNLVMRFSACVIIVPLLVDAVLVLIVRQLDLYLEPPTPLLNAFNEAKRSEKREDTAETSV